MDEFEVNVGKLAVQCAEFKPLELVAAECDVSQVRPFRILDSSHSVIVDVIELYGVCKGSSPSKPTRNQANELVGNPSWPEGNAVAQIEVLLVVVCPEIKTAHRQLVAHYPN